MIWVDRMVSELKKRELPLEWVDDMKTPSGRAHAGSLRTMVIHDLVYKVLVENNINSKFTYFFDDHDPMDGLPIYLDQKKYSQYTGMQLYKIPSPEPGFKSYAEYFAKDFQSAFEKLNCHPEIIWASELYNSGKMNGVIKEILDQVATVRKIYEEVTKKKPPTDWIPFNAVCQNCHRVGTTKAYKWDGEYVHYRCIPDMVKWAEGCGHEGKVSPYNGNGKLPWKIEWAAKWKVVGITVEGAGKDHMTKGGSHDIASEICRKVLHYPIPYAFAYEFFTVGGGKKMSSSKGAGISAIKISEILPPDLLRFLIVRVPIEAHLDFNPAGDTFLNLFDDYDRCLDAYYTKKEGKLPKGKPGEVLVDFARIMKLSEVRPLPEKRFFIARFRTVVNLVKTKADILSYAKKQKGSELNDVEKEWLNERVVYAEKYLADTALIQKKEVHDPSHLKSEQLKLSDEQKKLIRIIIDELKKKSAFSQDELKTLIFDAIKKSSLQPKIGFKGLYVALTGKEFGPHLGELILEVGIPKTIILFGNAVKVTEEKKEVKAVTASTESSIFSIDKKLAKEFPSISIGIAVIKNVTIKKTSPELQREIDLFLESQKDLTTEQIGLYPEVISYRKLYKQMGVDWHSRRPSPEALLRRIATKKGLYSVNNCVDAYNIEVMKNRVSVGAFDYDSFTLPTVLRHPKAGEEILLLGEKAPTKYTEKEIAYFDQKGGYNLDFNYRDSQRTAVRNKTQNLVINVDGVYDIGKDQVEKTLKEAVEMIIKHCGGAVENINVVTSS